MIVYQREHMTIVYDQKRERLIFFSHDRQTLKPLIWFFRLNDRRWVQNPQQPEGGISTREAVYVPDQDAMLAYGPAREDDPIWTRVYLCAENRWLPLPIDTPQYTVHEVALEYDPIHKLAVLRLGTAHAASDRSRTAGRFALQRAASHRPGERVRSGKESPVTRVRPRTVFLAVIVLLAVAAVGDAESEVITLQAKDTLSALEMNRGDVLEFRLRNGRVFTLVLEDTAAAIVERVDPGGIVYRFTMQVRVDGQPMTLKRYVCSQECFYEPYVIDGVRIWPDAVRDVFDLIPIRYPRRGNLQCLRPGAYSVLVMVACRAIHPNRK